MIRTILVLAANPKDTPQLRLDQEVREIDNGLQRAKKRDEFILKQTWATRPQDIRRAMLDLRPNIVHFCGHGSGEESIAFENDAGNINLVGKEALAGFFELFADKVECVVLNACHSDVQAEAIAQHIKYVVGMKRDIGDATAIEFAVAFYDALGAGESIEFAYRLACNAIQWTGTPAHLIPVLRIKPCAKQVNGEIVLRLDSSEREDFYMTEKGGSFQFNEDKTLKISGRHWERVWIRRKLPKNFRVSISFDSINSEAFVLSIGDGRRWKPDYHFVITPKWIALKKFTDEEKWNQYLQTVSDPRYCFGSRNEFSIELERNEGEVAVYMDGRQILRVQNEPDVNSFSYLGIAGGGDSEGSILVRELTIKELGG